MAIRSQRLCYAGIGLLAILMLVTTVFVPSLERNIQAARRRHKWVNVLLTEGGPTTISFHDGVVVATSDGGDAAIIRRGKEAPRKNVEAELTKHYSPSLPARAVGVWSFAPPIQAVLTQRSRLQHEPCRDVSKEAIQAISKLETLELVFLARDLGDGRLTDAISNKPHLKSVYLGHWRCDELKPGDVGYRLPNIDLERLVNVPELSQVNLVDVALESDDVRALAALPSLRYASLSGCEIAVDDLILLGSADGLEHLLLRGMPLSDSVVESFSGISNLKSLWLMDEHGEIEIKDPQVFGKFHSLETLKLTGVALPPKAIEAFVQLKGLKQLELWSTGLPADQLNLMQEALPDCSVSIK